jgi:DNA (cytosine-5)-methyltransferase 1
MGLHRAGFDVVGVDIKPQKNYPFPFVQGDALRPPVRLTDFDLVWASPPCQAHSSVTPERWRSKHLSLIEPTRDLLRSAGMLFVIENVPGAPLRPDIVLDGTMFGANTYRKRVFETNFFALTPNVGTPFGPWSRPGAVGVYGRTGSATGLGGVARKRVSRGNLAGWREAMGIDWMYARELAQAVPPAYAEYIGRAALAYLTERAAS